MIPFRWPFSSTLAPSAISRQPISLHLESLQNADRENAILCLHGHPGSSASMGVFTAHLSQRFRTLAPDLRGYGKSKAHSAFEMEQHLEDLIALLDRQAVKQVIVLGWSLGGILAMELALRYPDRVKGLILIATAARPWGDHPRMSSLDLVWTGIAGGINLVWPGWDWNIQTLGSRSLFRYLVAQQTPAVYRYLAREAVYAYFQTSKFAQQALNRRMAQGYNRVPDLNQIRCPALMLIGACDRHIAPAASRETAKALPQCEWEEFETTAHLLPWEMPELVLRRIDRWLEQQRF